MAVRERIFKPTRHIIPLRIAFLAAITLCFSACAVLRAPETRRIALFAPFEGRYREIGYNALYAARLAAADNPSAQVELLAVDAGGIEAVNRASALAQDPLVMAVVALGSDATAPEVLRAFGDIPVLIVGEWGAQPIGDTVFIFSNPDIAKQISTSPSISVTDAAETPAPVVGSDVFALDGFAKLRDQLGGVTVLSSGTLPDDEFTARYQRSDPFAPEPGLLATLTQSATSTAIDGWATGSREGMRDYLAPAFLDGYWEHAGVHRYVYVDGVLTEDTVE